MIMSVAGKKERFSRLYVYYMARKIANRIGYNGAQLHDALEAMTQYGAATDRTWPFHFNRVNTEPNSMAITEASQYKLSQYSWAHKESFKDYLHKEIPVVLGLYTGRLFWKLKGPLSTQVYKSINTIDNREHKGHAVTVIGYDDELLGGSWIIGNSLGLTWGDHGIGILPYECYRDIGESYVITEFAGIPVGKKIPRIDK
jgi:C1A family cysteine protease